MTPAPLSSGRQLMFHGEAFVGSRLAVAVFFVIRIVLIFFFVSVCFHPELCVVLEAGSGPEFF